MSAKKVSLVSGFVWAIGIMIGVIALWFILAFVFIGPFFTQLFGDLVYIGRERVWMYGVIVILGSFGFLTLINYYIVNFLTKTKTMRATGRSY